MLPVVSFVPSYRVSNTFEAIETQFQLNVQDAVSCFKDNYRVSQKKCIHSLNRYNLIKLLIFAFK